MNYKKINLFYILGLFLISVTSNFAQNVGINTTGAPPNNSAILDVASSDKGILIPRMDSTSRKNIVDPALGLMVFDSTNNHFYYHNGTDWQELKGGLHNEIRDADNDTKIIVDNTMDDDSIRFDIMGSRRLVLKQNANGKTMMTLPNNNSDIYIGENAGLNSDAFNNVFVGNEAGLNNTSGNSSTFIGHLAGYSTTTGGSLVFMGAGAGRLNSTGNFNVSIGATAGQLSDGSFNVFVGSGAGPNTSPITNGISNTVLGAFAGHNLQGSGNVFIGRNAGYYETGSNKLYIENSALGTPLIYGDFANDSLKIYGTLNINDAFSLPIVDGSNGQVLATNGTGQLSWTADGNDDLGNHTATQNVSIGSNAIQNGSSTANGLSLGTQNQLLLETAFQRSGHFTTTGVNNLGNPFGNYVEINNKSGTRALFGADGTGLYSLDTLNAVLGNWTPDGGITFHVSGGVKVMTLDKFGRLGIGRTAGTNILEIEGDASKTSAGNWLANSDARLKKNIKPLASAETLKKLLSLNGVTYEWNDTQTGTKRPEGIQYGFTAQNIQEVFPSLVSEDNTGYLQTPYGTYDAMTVEAIRALNDKIEVLERENAILKSKNKQLEINTAELAELKNAFAEFKISLKKNNSSTPERVIESEKQ